MSKDGGFVKWYRFGRKDDRLCGLLVRVPGYRSRGPGSIPRATRFSEKQWVWNGVHSIASKIEELLGRKSSGSSLEIRDYGRRRSAALTTWHPVSAEVGTNFSDKLWYLGRYSSFSYSGHGV
jgi:hypothetical protein